MSCLPTRPLAWGPMLVLFTMGLASFSQDRLAEKRSPHEDKLRQLSLTDLFGTYGRTQDRFGDDRALTKDHVLTEIIRRGGPECEKFLQEQLASQAKAAKEQQEAEQKKRENEAKEDGKKPGIVVRPRRRGDEQENLELLTALRRVQKKRDPLAVDVKVPADARSDTRQLPVLRVTLTNVDEEKAPVWFKYGGDYRSGRPTRWRVEVHDVQGNPVPPRSWEAMMGGGMFQQGPLQHGKSWSGHVPMDAYVRITEPGDYTVCVLYHNDKTIADMKDVNGLILCASPSFKIRVVKAAPTVVDLQHGSRQKAKALIAALSDQGQIRVVMGTYDADFHDFIDPKSREGQLHTMSWQAVPELLAALNDKSLSAHKRGWVLALLYVLTREGDLNPFADSSGNVLPAYEYRSIGCRCSSEGGTPSATAQQALAQKWQKFAAEYIEVREAK
jgi:hypothetical protein